MAVVTASSMGVGTAVNMAIDTDAKSMAIGTAVGAADGAAVRTVVGTAIWQQSSLLSALHRIFRMLLTDKTLKNCTI